MGILNIDQRRNQKRDMQCTQERYRLSLLHQLTSTINTIQVNLWFLTNAKRLDLGTARLALRHSITGFLVKKKSAIFCTLTIPTLNIDIKMAVIICRFVIFGGRFARTLLQTSQTIPKIIYSILFCSKVRINHCS